MTRKGPAPRSVGLRPDRFARPVLALGGERCYGPHLVEGMRLVAKDVVGGEIVGCGHYLPEEDPIQIAEALIAFFAD